MLHCGIEPGSQPPAGRSTATAPSGPSLQRGRVRAGGVRDGGCADRREIECGENGRLRARMDVPGGWGDLLESSLEFGLGRDPVGDGFGCSRLPDAVDRRSAFVILAGGAFYTRIAFSPSVSVTSTVLTVGFPLSLPDYESSRDWCSQSRRASISPVPCRVIEYPFVRRPSGPSRRVPCRRV